MLSVSLVLLLSLPACTGYSSFRHDPFRDSLSTPASETPTKTPILSDTSSRTEVKSETRINIESLGDSSKTVSGIEVMWEIPNKEVDGFILRYGFSKNNLSKEVHLKRTELETYTDQEFGEVFRYILQDIPSAQSIYLQLANKIGDQVSPFSEVFELKGEKKGPS